ncbi:hypothetical protein LXL04_023180 [Taraxacum kok-saghyz]
MPGHVQFRYRIRGGYGYGAGTLPKRSGEVSKLKGTFLGRSGEVSYAFLCVSDLKDTLSSQQRSKCACGPVGIMASQEHDRETAGDQPPLWGYVTKLEKLSGTGGGWSFKCNFCSETRKGSYYRRNWSTYAFIHSLKRNKLTPSRAQDLVYIHNNLRLLSRTPNDDVNMWDVGGDAFDSMEDVGFLEVANLSLDEPRFENDIISCTETDTGTGYGYSTGTGNGKNLKFKIRKYQNS